MKEPKNAIFHCRVICMSCGEVTHRQKLQDKLLEINPGAGEAIQRMVRVS